MMPDGAAPCDEYLAVLAERDELKRAHDFRFDMYVSVDKELVATRAELTAARNYTAEAIRWLRGASCSGWWKCSAGHPLCDCRALRALRTRRRTKPNENKES